MDDFIEVYDDALTPEQCGTLISRFEASDKTTRGRAGATVDAKKKNSHDITITHTHRGNISPAADKYIATSWILFQRAETLFGAAAGAR